MTSSSTSTFLGDLHSWNAEKFHERAISGDALQLLVAGPRTGKSTFLRHVLRRFEACKTDEIGEVEWQCHACRTAELNAMLATAREQSSETQRIAVLVDNIDLDFDSTVEFALREQIAFNARTPERGIIIIATSSHLVGQELNETERKELADLFQSLIFMSQAINSFLIQPLAPNRAQYSASLSMLLKACGADNLETGVADKILDFTGPYPPFVRAVGELLLSGAMLAEEFSPSNSSEFLLESLAHQSLAAAGDQFFAKTLAWLGARAPQAERLLDAVGTTGDLQNLSAHDLLRLNGFLNTACMTWPRTPSYNRQSEPATFHLPMMVRMGISEISERKKCAPTVLQADPPEAPSAHAAQQSAHLRDQTIFVERSGDRVPTIIALSEIEWAVINAMSSDAVRSVAHIAELAGRDLGDTRRAINRLGLKLAKASTPWLITNVMRRGYILHLTNPAS